MDYVKILDILDKILESTKKLPPEQEAIVLKEIMPEISAVMEKVKAAMKKEIEEIKSNAKQPSEDIIKDVQRLIQFQN
ncbi:MAG: hypothetical protein ACKOAD_02985 [Gammaproteobacteria bacterium]